MRADPPRRIVLSTCTVDLLTGELTQGASGCLSDRERSLLAYLVERPREVVCRWDIAEQVFGYVVNTRTRAVDKAMHRLRSKVEADPGSPVHLLTRHGEGYLFVPTDDVVPPPSPPNAPVRAFPPATWRPFIGRDQELRSLRHELHESRLVTVMGPGGVGKTRLVLEATRALESHHFERTTFCDLVRAQDRQGILHAVAASLGLRTHDDPEHAILESLACRGPQLLVLDNVERVARDLGHLVAGWLAALEVQILVTSRETLGIPGERLFVVTPLSAGDAEALYQAFAEAKRPDAALTSEDKRVLPQILEQLDHLPLAIELAAGRVQVLPPRELWPRMSDRFMLIARRNDDAGRHASLRANLDWSWALLSSREQTALSQLSVFEGDFTLAAVEQVLDVDGPIELVHTLVERSLIQTASHGRFTLLVNVKAYASAQLEEPEIVRQRHCTYFANGPRNGLDAQDSANLQTTPRCKASRHRGKRSRRTQSA
ncbi:MAG: winged helix-turn-helix domain-containing protein [Myxococcota bacterium]